MNLERVQHKALIPPAISSGSAFGIEKVELLVKMLPGYLQNMVIENEVGLDEIHLDVGIKPKFWVSGEMLEVDKIFTAEELETMESKFGKTKDDGRIGIPGTLHRISRVTNSQHRVIGYTIRIGRFIVGVSDCLRPFIERNNILVIGPPAVGKTTTLRDLVRIIASDPKEADKCVVCDTSNEIGGDGDVPHHMISPARRKMVPSRKEQHLTMLEIVGNYSPKTIVLDELAYPSEAETAQEASQKGTRIVATVHGTSLRSAMNNKRYRIILGEIDMATRQRTAECVFNIAIEVLGYGKYLVHPNVDTAIDELLAGREPIGIPVEYKRMTS